MKYIFSIFCMLLLTGCVFTMSPKRVTYREENELMLMVPPDMQIIPGTFEYYASTFHRAESILGKGYYKGKEGFILVTRRNNQLCVRWSRENNFVDHSLMLGMSP